MSEQLSAALFHSRYLQRIFSFRPELQAETEAALEQPYTREAMLSLLQLEQCSDEEALRLKLRRLRQSVMARLISRELTGRCTLNEEMETVSTLAEVAVEACLQFLPSLEPRYGQPIGEDSGAIQELIVVGMGKLGGRELNASSDIDLIFVYPEDGETNGERRISNHEYFTRIGRKLISLINDADANGFVFRVDMRLRPYGDSGPLVSSFASLENYLLTQGREWERYAWIKGRAMSGDSAGLAQLVTPFVYRKYLDYGAYASMRDLHAQIRREVARKDMADNIKLGPGGIREIEFIAQVHQLIRGGRNRQLQIRPTQKVLREVETMGLMEPRTIQELDEAYVFLRNLEHRLQYLDDAQTQMLPASSDDQHRIAISMGFADWDSFRKVLDSHRTRVAGHFEQVFSLPDENAQVTHPLTSLWLDIVDNTQACARLAELGYQQAEETQRQLLGLAQSNRYQHLPDKSRRRIDSLIPPLLEVAASFENADATLGRILNFLETISRRESYLALLAEHPQTLRRLASLMSTSPWVSQYLNRHPILLDELLDARLLYSAPDWARLGAQLEADLEHHAGDVEAQMDLLRHFQHIQVFRLVAQDIAGSLALTTLSDHLSALADLVLQVTLKRIWAELPKKHREEHRFAIIGYGKLGGKELGYASDLDIIFLYDDDHPDAPERYAVLARRLGNWLTALTPAGQLYEIDLRLRPNGDSGLLVSSTEAFDHYQKKEAWVWEHQALTRARFVAGHPDVATLFDKIRADVLTTPRDLDTLKTEVLSMRARIQESHPPRAGDVKYLRGGIVDVEFLVQYLILAHAAHCPSLLANSGNIALLRTAAASGLIPKELAEASAEAYREFRRLQHVTRLHDAPLTNNELSPLETALKAVRELWQTVFGENLNN